jgi:RNA polymerase sigma factor (sigma-70 family)
LRLEEDKAELRPSDFLEEWKVVKIALIRSAIRMLPKLERQVIRMVFYEGLTEERIAEKLKLSRSKVHRLKWKAVNKLFFSPLIRFLARGIKEQDETT